MSKLFKAKGFLSIPEAASYLTGLITELVTEADIYQLAMFGKLRLAVHFFGYCTANRGDLINESEVKWKEVIDPFARPPETTRVPDSMHIGGTSWIRFDEAVVSLTGLFELAMIGGEVTEIETLYHEHANDGIQPEALAIDGLFVCNEERTVFYRLTSKLSNKQRFYPIDALPDGTSIVATVKALEATAAILNGTETPVAAHGTTDLGKTKEQSYQVLIGALLSLLEGDDGQFKKRAALVAKLEEIGANKTGLSKSTLDRRLPECDKAFKGA